MEDLEGFFRKEEEIQMVEGLRRNTARYIDLFSQVAEELMPKRQKPINPDDVRILRLRNSDSSSKIFSKNRGRTIWICKILQCYKKMN